MNTKQVEELTGLTRQNIRYYERQGLLEPARADGNDYRDYSQKDVERLKLIKMLRMLDMPLKEIERVVNGEVSVKEAVEHQGEQLLSQKEQLQAAIEVCASIQKEKNAVIDVNAYLERMERMERMSGSGGMFAQIMNDYKQIAQEEKERRFSFHVPYPVNTEGTLLQAIQEYAAGHGMKLKIIKKGRYPEIKLDNVNYTIVSVLEEDPKTKSMGTKIICRREKQTRPDQTISPGRQKLFQGIHLIGVNIRRHRTKSILNLTICFLTVLVLTFYLGNLIHTQAQFDSLAEKIPVTAEIASPNGTLKNGLFIREEVLDALYKNGNVKDVKEIVELLGKVKNDKNTFPDQEKADTKQEVIPATEETKIWGVSSEACTKKIAEKSVQWCEDWNWALFKDGREVCIADKAFLEKYGYEPGDMITLDLGRYKQTLSGVYLEREEMSTENITIVGVMERSDTLAEAQPPELLIPLFYAKQLFEKNDKTYFASALSFTVKDPMELNALKQDLKDAGMKTVVTAAKDSYAGSAIRFDDAVFIETAGNLDRTLNLLKGYLPFLFLIVLLTGYVVPHLLLQGRREEYAVMRALGTSKKRCILLFFSEHILLAAFGGGLGAIAGVAAGAAKIRHAGLIWVIFLVCYLLGAAAAMWMFGRISIAAVLARRD